MPPSRLSPSPPKSPEGHRNEEEEEEEEEADGASSFCSLHTWVEKVERFSFPPPPLLLSPGHIHERKAPPFRGVGGGNSRRKGRRESMEKGSLF